MTREQIQEYTLKITRANRSELIVIVYELAIQYIDTAVLAYDANDFDGFSRNLKYSGKCVSDLLEALDFNYEPAFPLMRIYVFISKQLSLAPIKKDKDMVVDVRDILIKLKKSFEDIASQDDSKALMSNTQDVYAGLTYGRNSLNESLNGSANRGFCV